MNAKHTPTPWNYTYRSRTNFGPKQGWHVYKKGGALIAEVPSPQEVITSANDDPEATAAHIVRCVNHHDELVERLANLVTWMDDSDLSHTKSVGVHPFVTERTEFDVVAQARAILAKVRA